MSDSTSSANEFGKHARALVMAGALFFYVGAVGAAEVLEADVVHKDGLYTVRFDVRLTAPADKVKRHLTDYGNYAKHAKSIVESTVLSQAPDGTVRLRLRMRSCVLFFCRETNVVKDISEQADGTIHARIDSQLSDFRESTERWRLFADDAQHTRLQYNAELTPTFYVPPLIGPWWLKRKMRELLETNIGRFEALAHELPQ
jgi:hypothetical protein